MGIFTVLAGANRCMCNPEGGAVSEASWGKIHTHANDPANGLPSGKTRL